MDCFRGVDLFEAEARMIWVSRKEPKSSSRSHLNVTRQQREFAIGTGL